MVGLGKQFRIFDDNNSRSLDEQEFTKAMKEQCLKLTNEDIKKVFNSFDSDGSGEVNYDEYLRFMRGPMNAFRKKFVMQAFNKLDKDGSGMIEINDIKGVYNASRHPDVI